VNSSVAHAELLATFRRAQADAAHKLALIKAAANKGPKAIQAAMEAAAKAVKRRDAYATKLDNLGVDLKDGGAAGTSLAATHNSPQKTVASTTVATPVFIAACAHPSSARG
jgi:hypothetical protein